MRLSDYFDTWVVEDTADELAREPSREIAMRRNGGEEFAQNFFGGDQSSVRAVHSPCGLGPRIARYKDSEPINGIDENARHRFGVPYT